VSAEERPPEWIDLAADIRAVDGNHDLGAGALAAALTARGWTRASVPTESGAPDPLRRTWQEGWDAAMRFASQPVPAPEPSARLREAAQRYVAAREAYIACNDDENEEPCGHWHDQHEAYDDLRDAATPQDPEA
jgi:hypothetical protein